MACGIQRISAVNDGSLWNFTHQVQAGFRVGVRVCRYNDGLPPHLWQVLHKTQGALDTTSARKRRKVKRNHQDALQRRVPSSVLIQFKTSFSTTSRHCALENVWSASATSTRWSVGRCSRSCQSGLLLAHSKNSLAV